MVPSFCIVVNKADIAPRRNAPAPLSFSLAEGSAADCRFLCTYIPIIFKKQAGTGKKNAPAAIMRLVLHKTTDIQEEDTLIRVGGGAGLGSPFPFLAGAGGEDRRERFPARLFRTLYAALPCRPLYNSRE